MAKTPRLKRVKLTVYVLPKVVQYIDHLARSGFYGRGARSQAAERLICQQLESMVNDPLFKDEFERLNPHLRRTR